MVILTTAPQTGHIDETCFHNDKKSQELRFDGQNEVETLSDDFVTVSEQGSEIDDDLEENYRDDVLQENGWIVDPSKPIQQSQEFGTKNGPVLPTVESPEFGNVCIENSQNVHLGNKTFYSGPVTIKQFIYANPLVSIEAGNDGNSETKSGQSNTKRNETDVHNKENASDSVERVKGKWQLTSKFTILICTIVLIVLTAIVIFVAISTNKSNVVQEDIIVANETDSPIDEDGIKFVSRLQWGAQPSEPIENNNLTQPVPYVIISHTATQHCKTQAACVLIVRIAQTFHMSSFMWEDIGYNFLVGGDGLVYVGRSWDTVGAHSYGYNSRSMGISFIGTFTKDKPTKNQLKAAQKLIELGVKKGKIAHDYKLLAHCQVLATESPGAELYAILRKWPHWSSSP